MDTTSLIENNWDFLLSLLPEGWEQQAFDTQAVRNYRKIRDGSTLMRLLFMHLGLGYSLRETVALAEVAGLVKISDVALLQRLRNCGELFRRLLLQMAQELGMLPPPSLPCGLNVRLVDATNVKEPGKTGSVWRLHTVMRLPDLVSDHFELTSAKGQGTGESFTRIPVQAGECLMGDRIYATAAGIAHVHRHQGYTLVRINTNLVMESAEDGGRIHLPKQLSSLKLPGETGEWPVVVRHEGERIPGRLCAIRKTAEETARSIKKIHRRASKMGYKVQPETLEMARYVVIFTSVPQDQLPTAQVLALYRYRWQIELMFKRFKSLAQLGHLPKYEDASSKAWLYGKLLLCLLTEKSMRLASAFSPWGAIVPGSPLAQSLARV